MLRKGMPLIFMAGFLRRIAPQRNNLLLAA
jgi:hypothetical protein